MALPDALLDATVPVARRPLPDLRLADALPRARPAWDASDDVLPDAAVDAALPELEDAMCAEKWAAQVRAVPALGAELCSPPEPQPEASALCKPAAVQSAA